MVSASILDGSLLLPTSFDIAHQFVHRCTEFVTRRTGHGVCLCRRHGSLTIAVAVVVILIVAAAAAVTVANAARVAGGV